MCGIWFWQARSASLAIAVTGVFDVYAMHAVRRSIDAESADRQ